MPPWVHDTYNGLHGASGSRGKREESYWGSRGRTRRGGGGHSRPQSCPPAPAGPSAGPPPGPAAQTAAAGSAYRSGGRSETVTALGPRSTSAGPPFISAGWIFPSPVLCLKRVARAVGLLQVALQLLLPFPVGRLLLAQVLVLQLKPQERLPADRGGGSRARNGAPAGRLGGRG